MRHGPCGREGGEVGVRAGLWKILDILVAFVEKEAQNMY